MKTFDYKIPSQQITPTVDYTEVVFQSGRYLVLWHDNIVNAFSDKDFALAEYNRIITSNEFSRGDYR